MVIFIQMCFWSKVSTRMNFIEHLWTTRSSLNIYDNHRYFDMPIVSANSLDSVPFRLRVKAFLLIHINLMATLNIIIASNNLTVSTHTIIRVPIQRICRTTSIP